MPSNKANERIDPSIRVDKGSNAGKQAGSKPKVVRIIARLNVGGPARQVCMFHDKLAGDFDTHLIVGDLAEGEEDMSHLLSSQRNVLRLPEMSREISLLADARAFWKIWRFLRRERPDIVHTHTAKAGALGRMAAWLAGVPVVVHTYHGHVFQGYFSPGKTRMVIRVERFLGRISDRIIAVSDSQKEEICKQFRVAPPEKATVVYNGFELDQFSRASRQQARQSLGIPRDHVVAAWGGRMVPVKDVELLGRVIRLSAEKHHKISFLVAGDGTERPVLEGLIKGCSNVWLVGWRQDMDQIWAAADLVLLTSRNEGTPTTLIEAMAAGLPFVAPRVGGVEDLAAGPWRRLPHGLGEQAANGFLTARTADALLYGIEQIATQPQLAKAMAAAGRAFVTEKFSASRLIAEISHLYRELLEVHLFRASGIKSSQNHASREPDAF